MAGKKDKKGKKNKKGGNNGAPDVPPPDGLPPPPDDEIPDDLPPLDDGPPAELPPSVLRRSAASPPPPDDDYGPPAEIAPGTLAFFQEHTGCADEVEAEEWLTRYPESPELAVQMYQDGGAAAGHGAVIPPPDDEPPPDMPGDPELQDRQLAVDRYRAEVASLQSAREQTRGTPEEAQVVEELRHVEAALAHATGELEEYLHARNGAPVGGGMAAKLDAQAETRRMFQSFAQGKDHMDRSDVVASIHHLGYDCDDDYCTQLLQTFAGGAEFMDGDCFAQMWAHLAPQEVAPAPAPDEPPPGAPPGAPDEMPPPPPGEDEGASKEPQLELEPQPEPEHPVVDDEWRLQRLEELKAEEEERLREEARSHARTVLHEEDDLAHMLRDEDILRALFSRIDPGSTGRTSRNHWLKFLEADVSAAAVCLCALALPLRLVLSGWMSMAQLISMLCLPLTLSHSIICCHCCAMQEGILSVMKLNDMERGELDQLFSRWPASGITFPAFVALLRAQFGRALGIEYHYHDEVKKVQEQEQKLHEEMVAREGDRREEERKAKEMERERMREEVIDEMRQSQLTQLAEIKAEVKEKLVLEKDLESQSLLEAELAEVETAMMGTQRTERHGAPTTHPPALTPRIVSMCVWLRFCLETSHVF